MSYDQQPKTHKVVSNSRGELKRKGRKVLRKDARCCPSRSFAASLCVVAFITRFYPKMSAPYRPALVFQSCSRPEPTARAAPLPLVKLVE